MSKDNNNLFFGNEEMKQLVLNRNLQNKKMDNYIQQQLNNRTNTDMGVVNRTNGFIDLSNDPCNKNSFNLYQQRDSGNQLYNREATHHYHEETPLSIVYFSEGNINLLQDMIKYQVYKQSNNQHVINRQSDTELKIIMRSIYLQYGRNDPNNIKEQVAYLNNIVVKEAVPGILSGIEQYNAYITKITKLPIPIPRPINLSNKGTKTLQENPFI